MTGPGTPGRFTVRKEIESLTSKPQIMISLALLLIAFCFMPVFLLLLPVAIIIMVVLYKTSESNEAKALKIARSHLPSGAANLEIVEGVGLSDSLVLNDWGIVHVASGKPPVETSWTDISAVDETGIGVLAISSKRAQLEINLCSFRYMLIAETMDSKLPGKTNFYVDPKSGKSNIKSRLQRTPRTWGSKAKRLVASDSGIECDGKRMSWNDIVSVVETHIEVEDGAPIRTLRFSSAGETIEVDNGDISLGNETPCYTGYDELKMIVWEMIPGKTRFQGEALTPAKRALLEFERCQEFTKGSFAFAIESGKYHVVEPHYKNMMKLVDMFNLSHHSSVQEFFQDYGLLLQNTGRQQEANQLAKRITSRNY